MEMKELISLPDLEEELAEHCPFKEPKVKTPARASEDIGNDDRDSVEARQANDGGVLGENLLARAPGVGAGGPFPPDDFLFTQRANDSQRGKRRMLRMEAYKDAKAGDFPFTVAAHHLIPGNASLYKAAVKLVNFMDDGGKIKTFVKKRSKTIDGDIGYDVNGSHNGIWLPGNYAIKTALPKRKTKSGATLPARAGTTPVKGKSWEQLSAQHEAWQYSYVAGACKAAKGQFHDSHERPYSASVRENLTKIVTALTNHLDTECPECKDKSPIPPPYRIKNRLYQLSKELRNFVRGQPAAWKAPWFTSQKWSEKFFAGGKITKKFMDEYESARAIRPQDATFADDDD